MTENGMVRAYPTRMTRVSRAHGAMNAPAGNARRDADAVPANVSGYGTGQARHRLLH